MPVETSDHAWFYQGHQGWWQYDERTNLILEEAFEKEEGVINVLIAGSVYIVDFENSCQYKQNAQSRRRKIKREVIKDVNGKKGIAGIPTPVADNDAEMPEIARYIYLL